MKKLIPVLVLFFAFSIYAQKEANIWCVGENAGLDFSTNPPNDLVGYLSTDKGSASISNANGDLQFYTDGSTVYDKTGSIMYNAEGLLGDSSSAQSAIIVPKPGSSKIYYLFTVGTDFVTAGIRKNPGFNYYTIDMSKNIGLGEITEGPINLAINPNNNSDLSNSWSEKVAAVKGEDCDTFWVISFVENTFYVHKVSLNGVEVSNPVLSTVNFNARDKR